MFVKFGAESSPNVFQHIKNAKAITIVMNIEDVILYKHQVDDFHLTIE